MFDPKAAISLIKYKPGWKFEATRDWSPMYGEHWLIYISIWVPSRDNPVEQIKIARAEVMPFYVKSGLDLAKFVYQVVRSAEMHELSEWFTYDGQHVVEPHPAEPVGRRS